MRTLFLLLAPSLLLADPVKILFIGNSLTADNDLPAEVCAIVNEAGIEAECVASVAPGRDLRDHWSGESLRTLRRGDWDWVVLQQGPSALPESRAMLVDWAGRWAKEIRKRGAEPALLMVWPSAPRFGDFPRVIDSYTAAAERSKSALIPAGQAWQAVWKVKPSLPLYAQDGFHPAPRGTRIAALCTAWALFGDRVKKPVNALEEGIQAACVNPAIRRSGD